MDIGIKYCGGCNPKYDRKEFLHNLKRNSNFNFEIADLNKVYDIVIVLCGCNSSCVNHEELKFKLRKILVKSQEDYYEVNKILYKYSSVQEE